MTISDPSSSSHDIADILDERQSAIRKMLIERGSDVFGKQEHLDDGMARDYWHYGYMIALRDVANMIRTESIKKDVFLFYFVLGLMIVAVVAAVAGFVLTTNLP